VNKLSVFETEKSEVYSLLTFQIKMSILMSE
jgi:hypothetical protein